MALNQGNRITPDSNGVLSTETGYWLHQIRGNWVVHWDTVRGEVAARWFPTLLSARRFIERADGEPEVLSAPELRGCFVPRLSLQAT